MDDGVTVTVVDALEELEEKLLDQIGRQGFDGGDEAVEIGVEVLVDNVEDGVAVLELAGHEAAVDDGSRFRKPLED